MCSSLHVETHGLSGPVPAITGDKWGYVVVGNIISDRVKGSITCFAIINPQATCSQTGTSVIILCVLVHKCISTTIKCWREFSQLSDRLSVGELPSHGHLVRTWNVVNSSRAKLYRDGYWEYYNNGAFRVSGSWDSNVGNSNDAPQNGYGDPAGTTDGTGDNAYHNNVSPAIAVYIWKRVS